MIKYLACAKYDINFYLGRRNYMKSSAIKDFTEGNIAKQLIIFSLPLFLSNLLQVVYNMVDMLVVGIALGNPGISAAVKSRKFVE